MRSPSGQILVVNLGSSSHKCTLFADLQPVWRSYLEWRAGFTQATLRQDPEMQSKHVAIASHEEALALALTPLKHTPIQAIGHRVVHGGDCNQSARVTPDLKKRLEALSALAPLHNPINLLGIQLCEELFANVPQLAVFDTAFHRTLPQAHALYPGPYAWKEEGIYRYGFHGISFQYCYTRAEELLNTDLSSAKVVICHLGSGASLCAIEKGQSLDTTMGFTPLDGLMMDTRCGSIDPGILLFLLRTQKRTLASLDEELNAHSGLLGISGLSSDMRDILQGSSQGNARAELALQIYLHRLICSIGSMVASLQGIDILIFTAGIGQHAPLIRQKACDALAYLGCQIDPVRNVLSSPQDLEVSSSQSKVTVLRLHTQEDLEIAKECLKAFG